MKVRPEFRTVVWFSGLMPGTDVGCRRIYYDLGPDPNPTAFILSHIDRDEF